MRDITGNKYGDLTAISFYRHRVFPSGQKKALWSFGCSCGNTKVIQVNHVASGKTRSCGCNSPLLTRKRKVKHGFTNNPIYHVWSSMKARCYNKKNDMYKTYGGRGITVCDEWMNAKIFCTWAINNGWKKELQIDRKNNDLGYFPKNCRFITPLENARNRRLLRSNNTSGYCGVGKAGRSWVARIMVEGEPISLGTHRYKIDAARARDDYIVKHNLNMPLNLERE